MIDKKPAGCVANNDFTPQVSIVDDGHCIRNAIALYLQIMHELDFGSIVVLVKRAATMGLGGAL